MAGWRWCLACVLVSCAFGLNVPLNKLQRRDVLRVAGLGLAPAFAAPGSVSAKGKRSLELAASEAEEKARLAEVTGIKAGAAGKGLRGDSTNMDKFDTVQYNRDNNQGVARDANGNKVSRADRNRPPEELGLKQWDGN